MPLTRVARDRRRIGVMKSRKTFSDQARWSFQGNYRRKTVVAPGSLDTTEGTLGRWAASSRRFSLVRNVGRLWLTR